MTTGVGSGTAGSGFGTTESSPLFVVLEPGGRPLRFAGGTSGTSTSGTSGTAASGLSTISFIQKISIGMNNRLNEMCLVRGTVRPFESKILKSICDSCASEMSKWSAAIERLSKIVSE
jgi:hypothetical protein